MVPLLVAFLVVFQWRGSTTDVLGSGGVAAMDGGGAHTCALTDGGGVRCWGWNFYGQVGDGTSQSRFAPVDVCADAACESPLLDIVAIGAGQLHSCAVDAAGGVACWGRNFFGEVGDGTTDQRSTPVNVCAPAASTEACGALSRIVAVTAGSAHTCALTDATGVLCWGDNAFGQLGDGTTTASTRPVPACQVDAAGPDCAPLTGIAAVAAGSAHTCARMVVGDVLCWGDNAFGQLGDDQDCGTACAAPVSLGMSDVVSVTAGGAHTCAITSDGAALCWGENGSGQLGDGTQTRRHTPVEVCVALAGGACTGGLPPTGAVATGAGHSHTCALDVNGDGWCWGGNSAWQLGNGTNSPSRVPIRVAGITSAQELSAAGSHTCVAMPAGNARCWGFNGDGRLGLGAEGIFLTPVDVVGFGGEKAPTPTPTASLTPGPTPTDTPTPAPLLGDADCDAAVTAVDAALMLQLVAALIGGLPCGPQADVNDDGSVTAIDAALVLQMVAGLL